MHEFNKTKLGYDRSGRISKKMANKSTAKQIVGPAFLMEVMIEGGTKPGAQRRSPAGARATKKSGNGWPRMVFRTTSTPPSKTPQRP